MYLHHEIKGEGEVIVLLHGAFVNSAIWRHQYQSLSRQYRVISIDLRGHGHSSGSQLEEYSVDIFSEDVIRLLDDYKIDKAFFFGLSLGSMVAQNVAAAYPDRVKGLVLVGATASLRLSFIEKAVTSLIFPKWMAMMLFSRLSTRSFMKLSFLLTWFIRGNRWLGNDDTREEIRKSIAMVSRSELKKIYAAVHGFRLQNLNPGSFPVLMISGQYDSRVIHRHTRYLQKKLGERARMVHIENAGHACNYDSPLRFNYYVEQWLNDHARAEEISSQEVKAG